MAVGSSRRLGVGRRIVVVVGDIEVGRIVGHRTGDHHPAEEGHRRNNFGWTCLREEYVCSAIGDCRSELDIRWNIW